MRKLILAVVTLLFLFSTTLGFAEITASDIVLEDYFTNRDLSGDWDERESTAIELSGNLSITEAGTYILSGTIHDGTITVDVGDDDKVQLVLNGVSLTCSTSACIVVNNADKVFITLAENTENTVTSTGFTPDSPIDGAIYSKDDTVFNGKGKLTISSGKHGIVVNDDAKFASGTYLIHAGERGISAKDSVRIFDGAYTIYSGKTPIRVKNKKNAEKGNLIILGGTFYLHTDGTADN